MGYGSPGFAPLAEILRVGSTAMEGGAAAITQCPCPICPSKKRSSQLDAEAFQDGSPFLDLLSYTDPDLQNFDGKERSQGQEQEPEVESDEGDFQDPVVPMLLIHQAIPGKGKQTVGLHAEKTAQRAFPVDSPTPHDGKETLCHEGGAVWRDGPG